MTYRVDFIVKGAEYLSIYVDTDDYDDAIAQAKDCVEDESYLDNIVDWEIDDVIHCGENE